MHAHDSFNFEINLLIILSEATVFKRGLTSYKNIQFAR